MAVNGNRKGKAGERELAAFLRERGFYARRGQQHKGGEDSPDVVCGDIAAAEAAELLAMPLLHLECKRTENLRLYDALTQAVNDAGAGKVPVVAHRRSRKEWVAILRLEDLLEIMRWQT